MRNLLVNFFWNKIKLCPEGQPKIQKKITQEQQMI